MFLVSLPYFNYGGLLSNTLEIENRLINTAINNSQTNNIEHIELRELKARNDLYNKQEKVSMIRKLPKSGKDTL